MATAHENFTTNICRSMKFFQFHPVDFTVNCEQMQTVFDLLELKMFLARRYDYEKIYQVSVPLLVDQNVG